MVIWEGAELVDFNKIFTLSSSAAYLWRKVEGKVFSTTDLRDFLLDEYDVEKDVAERDALIISKEWKEAGLISE